MSAKWDACLHVWKTDVDSQSHNETHLAVTCIKCRCPGEKDIVTDSVTWPTT